MPGFHAGHPARNKGLRYPADPPTVEEIVAVMRIAGDGLHGRRLRGLIVVLWRAGLRIDEALALREADLDRRRGSILVRRGKGGGVARAVGRRGTFSAASAGDRPMASEAPNSRSAQCLGRQHRSLRHARGHIASVDLARIVDLSRRRQRTVGSPTRRKTTVARYASGEQSGTKSTQELRSRRE
jgi:integrase